MSRTKVKECSEQLKKLLAEQHNVLDASVKQELEEVIEALDALQDESDEENGIRVLLAIASFLRIATNIADLISTLNGD